MTNADTDHKGPNRKQETGFHLLMQGLFSVAFAGYGIYGLLVDDIIMPFNRHRRAVWLHFHGFEAWVLFAACSLAAIAGVFWILRRFVPKQKEKTYANLSVAAGVSALSVMMLMGVIGAMRLP